MKPNKKDIDFLFEIGSLRNVQRAWRQQMGVDVANNLEHSFRVAFIALVLARMESVEDEGKIMKLALMHDLEESRTADHSHFQKPYVKLDKEKATKDVFEGTSLEDFYKDLFKEYKKMESMEAKIVKDADQLDIDFELKELEEQGHQIPVKWLKSRNKIKKETFHTESAKKLYELVWKTDRSDWYSHLFKFD
ncbi:MAG: HD domain-containing protein [bacterium]|nr:HD domain-containing protein [bacterium]MDZ4231596.1 HD domain-containing protein [Patescibacteria group bacterium]